MCVYSRKKKKASQRHVDLFSDPANMWKHSSTHSTKFSSIYFSLIDTELILIYLFCYFTATWKKNSYIHNDLIKMTVPRAVHHSLINNFKNSCLSVCWLYVVHCVFIMTCYCWVWMLFVQWQCKRMMFEIKVQIF